MKLHMTLLAAASVLSFSTYGALAQDSAKSEIEAANATFEAAYNKGDAPGVASAYAEDTQVLAPGQPLIKGKADIEAFWKGAMGAGLSNLDLVTQEVETTGDLAVEVVLVSYDMPASSGEKTRASGKYVVVSKKGGASWKLYRDIWHGKPRK